jgi:hypothetical protein
MEALEEVDVAYFSTECFDKKESYSLEEVFRGLEDKLNTYYGVNYRLNL